VQLLEAEINEGLKKKFEGSKLSNRTNEMIPISVIIILNNIHSLCLLQMKEITFLALRARQLSFK
jgi:hypothetical protein